VLTEELDLEALCGWWCGHRHGGNEADADLGKSNGDGAQKCCLAEELREGRNGDGVLRFGVAAGAGGVL